MEREARLLKITQNGMRQGWAFNPGFSDSRMSRTSELLCRGISSFFWLLKLDLCPCAKVEVPPGTLPRVLLAFLERALLESSTHAHLPLFTAPPTLGPEVFSNNISHPWGTCWKPAESLASVSDLVP